MFQPERIHLREVSPRDGLQGEPAIVATSDKVHLVDMLTDAGFKTINVTSFVRPTVMPQMADAAEVMSRIRRAPGVIYDVTVPNRKGVERAIAAGADALVVFVAASDEASRRNVRRGTQEAMREAIEVIGEASGAGLRSTATISTAFGSPYEGDIPTDRVLAMAESFVAAGADTLSLGDTTGQGAPKQVAGLVRDILERFPTVDLALHLHDTRGLGMANILAAMDAGATHFDCAVGGIGGSPLTKNSAGNVSTEDLVSMCERVGIQTGVKLETVLRVFDYMHGLLNHPMPGRVGNLSHGAS